MKTRQKLSGLVAISVLALAANGVLAQIAVDGTLDSGYGAPLATQTIGTGFGDSTIGDGTSGGGSELDAAYATVQNGMLYLMFTGNFENNGNHLDVFIDDGRPGQNTLSAGTSGALGGMNGSIFSSGFNATYALDANDYNNTLYLDLYNFPGNTAGYAGGIALSSNGQPGVTTGVGNNGDGSTQNYGGIQIGINNTNTAGVDGSTGVAVADPSVPNAVTTGIEFGIPLSALGNPTNPIKVLADINGGGDGYLSNQFLPGLPAGTGNVGDGTEAYSLAGKSGAFDFTNLPNEYFTVNVPATNGIWITPGDGNWSEGANWSSYNGTDNTNVPNSAGAQASFSNAAGGTITVDGNFTVGTINFNSTGFYDLVPDGNNDPLTLSNVGNPAAIVDFGGSHEIDVPLNLATNTNISTSNHGDTLLIFGDISGPGALGLANPGGGIGSLNSSYIMLAGNDTYTGGTILNGGTVLLGSPTALPAGTVLTMNASDLPDPILDLGGYAATVSSLVEITGPNTFTLGADAIIQNSGGSSTTFTYAGDNAAPSTFGGNIAGGDGNGGGAALSLIVASGSLTLTGTNSFTGTTTINSGASLTVANALGSALTATSGIINNGSLTIEDLENVGSLTGTGTVSVATGGTLQLRAGTGTFTFPVGQITLAGGAIDITDNGLVINFGTAADPVSDIRAALFSGSDKGLWDGPGLISSTVIATPGTAIGYADGNTDAGTPAAPNTILLHYTWLGDLNLDGVVNSSDFSTLSHDMGMTGADWAQGDLNYDGVVNADDAALFMVGAALSGGNTISVPEPASLMLLLALPLFAPRRRRI